MADAVNSPNLENGKLVQNCTEGLTQGNAESFVFFAAHFFPVWFILFVLFRIDIY